MADKLVPGDTVVGVVGLGYVGLPLAKAFSGSLKVIGFDISGQKIRELSKSIDNPNISFTDRKEELRKADFSIICVPTPVTRSKEPDLSYVETAARIIGQNLKKGSVVIMESTVYPGVTEEIIKPILESESGFKCGKDFKIAYSPERVNPGDDEHSIDKITKVVAGMDEEATRLVAALYRRVAPDVFIARNIRTAESAKVIENIQRDLNIALMNELSIIFEKIGLNTQDVLDAAGTKWNFHHYHPGLVGGHCIPVDPYYLVYKSKELGYPPQVILAGRVINDYMAEHVAEMTIRALNEAGKVIKDSRVLIMGLTYKGDVADTRESPVKRIIKELEDYRIKVVGFDPLLDADDIEKGFGVTSYSNVEELKKARVDAIILAVPHTSFRKFTLNDLNELQKDNPVLIDVPGVYDAGKAQGMGFYYKTL